MHGHNVDGKDQHIAMNSTTLLDGAFVFISNIEHIYYSYHSRLHLSCLWYARVLARLLSETRSHALHTTQALPHWLFDQAFGSSY